jgi:hypothetical protein
LFIGSPRNLGEKIKIESGFVKRVRIWAQIWPLIRAQIWRVIKALLLAMLYQGSNFGNNQGFKLFALIVSFLKALLK